MPTKKRMVPAPIDRPLSRAYLRQFTGWSTAYPPGISEPTSLRQMENMWVDRNGALAVRPGLRYLSFLTSPDINKVTDQVPGVPIDKHMIGTQEPFYTANGDKALLFAVRETNGTVGFRAILFTGSETVVRTLTDPAIDFKIPQGEAALNFTSATTHVDYLQIDNKIVALSDAGEAIRVFFVGAEKIAKKIHTVTMPDWQDGHKLAVVHPTEAFITKQSWTYRYNNLPNPSFEIGPVAWAPGTTTAAVATPGDSVVGVHKLELRSTPTRTNLQTNPLNAVDIRGHTGWHSHKDWGNPDLSNATNGWLKVNDSKGKGTFLAYGAKLTYGIVPGQQYVVGLHFGVGTHVEPIVVMTFYNAAGAKIGSFPMVMVSNTSRPNSLPYFTSPAIAAPAGTVAMRLSVGGRNQEASSTFVKVREITLCKAGEEVSPFDGDSGANFFWLGAKDASVSVYHPPANVKLTSARVGTPGGAALVASLSGKGSVGKTAQLKIQTYNKDGVAQSAYTAAPALTTAYTRVSVSTATTGATAVSAEVELTVSGVARTEVLYIDAAMLEYGTATLGAYFDGDTAPTDGVNYQWVGPAHEGASRQATYQVVPDLPIAATPAPTSLVSSDALKNVYKVGFFYAFENEVGESAHSMISEIRVMRPWSNWLWQTAGAGSIPSGIATTSADLCCDQLTATVPQAVYDQALQEGAVKWNLYVMAWSDQEPVPVVAVLAGTRDLRSKPLYKNAGWIAITPQRKIGVNDSMLPTKDNRENYSVPPGARTGLVAGDRLILLGDSAALATIKWTSNRPGQYLNLTPSRGGGAKTLTTGNLHIPADVVLWQNPQSADTLTILCTGSDGRSISYYMMPSEITSQSSNIQVMGFEETTSTPGTQSPYGNEVMNNALFRPTDRSLLKSTAANYNISHKAQTDKIANVWWQLSNKHWIMSVQHDNRLFYLVQNPQGALLESGCKGNEIWVFDAQAEAGTWSRFLVQGQALRVFNVGTREYVGITRPDGLYYLDHTAREDDYVSGAQVLQRPIPWRFETNTQGANRAHDAWAHLQQVQITLGNFKGTARYGLRGHDVHNRDLEFVKKFTDNRPELFDEPSWDVDDILQVRRDFKEWFLFGESIDGTASSGQVNYVQYRYTPVSVNVGYELGSIETFEYGSNPEGYSENGIPLNNMDYTRP